jgi:hypothetical protein
VSAGFITAPTFIPQIRSSPFSDNGPSARRSAACRVFTSVAIVCKHAPFWLASITIDASVPPLQRYVQHVHSEAIRSPAERASKCRCGSLSFTRTCRSPRMTAIQVCEAERLAWSEALVPSAIHAGSAASLRLTNVDAKGLPVAEGWGLPCSVGYLAWPKSCGYSIEKWAGRPACSAVLSRRAGSR